MAKRGRPTKYTEEIADRICSELAEGLTLSAVCRGDGMPPESTVRLWAMKDYHGFSAKYAEAREIGYLKMFDDLFEIADSGNPEDTMRARLRVDTRKWAIARALPKLFGDKVDVTSAGEKVEGITVNLITAFPDSDDDDGGASPCDA